MEFVEIPVFSVASAALAGTGEIRETQIPSARKAADSRFFLFIIKLLLLFHNISCYRFQYNTFIPFLAKNIVEC